ncbi:MAG: DUF6384 family protein [Devosia sp.]|nr:DUF6384 family protein [Devosia sp.]
MTMPEAADAASLSDDMLTMDVADTLRHGIDVPAGASDDALIGRLRAIYLQQGIEASDAVLREGVEAMLDGRFVYVPPARRLAWVAARLYVARHKWGPPVFALALALAVGLGAYFFGYRPYRASQAEQARLELTQSLPAQMDALYQTVFNETKVQSAAADADDMRTRGKEAAARGDRSGAERAVAELEALRDRLQQTYTLRVVDKEAVKPGFWTFPPNNSEATNYYIVVEAVGASGSVLSLPVTSEETGQTQTVSSWGLRVPQTIYEAVMADKQDDGTIQHAIVGFKQEGFIDVDYAIPVLGGALTQW